jgi:hypothetical protein
MVTIDEDDSATCYAARCAFVRTCTGAVVVRGDALALFFFGVGMAPLFATALWLWYLVLVLIIDHIGHRSFFYYNLLGCTKPLQIISILMDVRNRTSKPCSDVF